MSYIYRKASRYPDSECESMYIDLDDNPSAYPGSLSSHGASESPSGSDEEDECSSPDTPASEAPSLSVSLATSLLDPCTCHYNAKCAFCIPLFEQIYETVRMDLYSSDESTDVVLKVKHLIPAEPVFFKAPQLVNIVVQQMEKIKENRELDACKNDLIRKAFKVLYRIWDFFACSELERPAGGGHPPLLEHIRSNNILSLFRHAPKFLDIYATCVPEAHGQTNAKFVRLTHWYLHRAMMGRLTEERRRPVRLSNGIVSRLVKFLIQLPHYMIVDIAFCLSVFLQSGKSTLYPSSFLTSDPAVADSYRTFISNAFTKESIFSALASAMKTNSDLTNPCKIAMELHANIVLAVIELFWGGAVAFPNTSACQELASTVARTLAMGERVQGGRDRFKGRIVQIFDRIILLCFKCLDRKQGQTKFLYKLLPFFTIDGAMKGYIYHGWGAPYSVITGTEVAPGSSSPPLISAIGYYLHSYDKELRKFTSSFPTIKLTWEDRLMVLDVLGSTDEIYHILNNVYENQHRLRGEIAAASILVQEENRRRIAQVDILGDWERIFFKAKHMLYLPLGSLD